MTEFRVWAPRPSTVALELGGERRAMTRDEKGWWRVSVETEGPTDYRFVLDDGDALPDPRSPWQAYGVHGASRTVDHAAFRWRHDGFRAPPLASAVIYELHIGTFTEAGTFEAALDRLDHLVELGITHVELMPVNEFSGRRGWGYDGVDLFAPHHAYGGPEGLKRFVDACHGKGLAVILDVVYNHLGPAGNYLDRFGAYFTDRYATPWGKAVNLDDQGSDEVRRFFCDNALMWLGEYRFDALRLDAVHAYFDQSALPFLEQLAREVGTLAARTGRPLALIAESDLNDPRLIYSLDRGGFGLDAQWSDDFHHALHSVITGERDGYYEDFGEIGQLAKALKQAFVYDGVPSAHRGRRHGRKPTGLAGNKFLGYIQNHDQIGNRARGERISHLADPELVKIAAALVYTAPFVPMLFQGEEWATRSPFQYFTDHEDPELAEAVRNGRRSEFQAFGWRPEDIPDPQDPATFERSRLDWSELGSDAHRDMLQWYQKLIRLRRREPALVDGDLERTEVYWDEARRWLIMARGPWRIACNFSAEPQALPLKLEREGAEVVLASAPDVSVKAHAVELPARAVAILRS